MFQKKKAHLLLQTEQRLTSKLIDVEQDLRLCDNLLLFKKSFSQCTEVLYESENLFEENSSGYHLMKRIFGCYSLGFARLFESMEKLQSENRLLENKATVNEQGDSTLSSRKSSQARKSKESWNFGGATLDGFKLRGVEPMQEDSTPSVVADFERMRLMRVGSPCPESEETVISLSGDQMRHLRVSQTSMSTSNFINHIGAHLNTVRAKIDAKGSKRFGEEISGLLEEFQEYQKDIAQFINRQALEVPAITFESDLQVLVEEVLGERKKWRAVALERLSQLIERSKAKVLRLLQMCHQKIDKVEEVRKEAELARPPTPKQCMNREIQTTEAQEQHTLIECFGEQAVLLETTKQHNQQLEESLYSLQCQLDTCRIDNSNLRERAELTKDQLSRLRVQLDDLEVRVIGEHAEKEELRMRLEKAAKMDVAALVEEFAEQYSIEMRLGIRGTVERVLVEVGLLQPDANDKQELPDSADSLHEKFSSSAGIGGRQPIKQHRSVALGRKLSNRSFDSFKGYHRSIIQQLGQLKKAQEQVLKSVQQGLMSTPTEPSSVDGNSTVGNNFNYTAEQHLPGLVIKEEEQSDNSEDEFDQPKKILPKRKDTVNSQVTMSSVDGNGHYKPNSGKRTSQRTPAMEKQLKKISKYAKRNSAFVMMKPHPELAKSIQGRYSLTNHRDRKEVMVREKSQDIIKRQNKSIGRVTANSAHTPPKISIALKNFTSIGVNTDSPPTKSNEFVQTEPIIYNKPSIFQSSLPMSKEIQKSEQPSTNFLSSVSKTPQISTPLQLELVCKQSVNINEEYLLTPQPSPRHATADPAKQRNSLKPLDNSLAVLKSTEVQEQNVRSSTQHVSRPSKISDKQTRKFLIGVKPSSSVLSTRNGSNGKLSKQFSNKKSQLAQYTSTLLKDPVFELLKDSEELRQQLQQLLESNHSSVKLPQRLQKAALAQLLAHLTQSHQSSCGKRICRHLLRFLQRLKLMVDTMRQQSTRRRPLGVKLHNINEIPIDQRTAQVAMKPPQPYFYF